MQKDSVIGVEGDFYKTDVEQVELKNSFEDTSTRNKITNMGNVASMFPYQEIFNVELEQQNNYVEVINNSENGLNECSPTFEMDIQEEVVVTTSTKAMGFNDMKESSEKRKSKFKSVNHSNLKRRLTMDGSDLRSGKSCEI